MMGVIVKQLYAVLFSKELEPTRYQPVFGQGIGNAIVWYAQLARDRDGGQRILYVMPAWYTQLDLLYRFPMIQHRKGGMAITVILDMLCLIIRLFV